MQRAAEREDDVKWGSADHQAQLGHGWPRKQDPEAGQQVVAAIAAWTGGRAAAAAASTFYYSTYTTRSTTGDMGELNPTGLFSSPLELVPLADPRKGMHPTGEAGLLLEPAPNAPGGYCPMLP